MSRLPLTDVGLVSMVSDSMGEVTFQAFNDWAEVQVYRTHLPHWRQEGVTYFVTFRLGDAIPGQALAGWRSELVSWLAAHGVTYEPSEWPKQLYVLPKDVQEAYWKLGGSRLDSYLDRGMGSCLLAEPRARHIVEQALQFFSGSRLYCGDFVVMPIMFTG